MKKEAKYFPFNFIKERRPHPYDLAYKMYSPLKQFKQRLKILAQIAIKVDGLPDWIGSKRDRKRIIKTGLFFRDRVGSFYKMRRNRIKYLGANHV